MKKEFWVTNISKKRVVLSDLNVTIPSFSSINLLDAKHYSYNLEQLQKSAQSGSLFIKRKMILVRKNSPIIDPNKERLKFIVGVIPDRSRSTVKVEENYYNELDTNNKDFQKENEEFAEENAELTELDQIRSIKKI